MRIKSRWKIRTYRRAKSGSGSGSHCSTLCNTGINTNPFTLKWGEVLGNVKKKVEKDTLLQLLGKPGVSVLVLSAVGPGIMGLFVFEANIGGIEDGYHPLHTTGH